MTAMRDVRADGWAQRGGIDRFVDLRDGSSIKIDEKVRYEDYGDIFLEYWSSREHNTPGWTIRDLTCDYIAYAIVPTETCYLFPFQVLRRCAQEYWPEWKHYKKVFGENPGYTTEGRAIPTEVLLTAIRDAMVIKWDA
jgi:hypothetical protein